ncbi:unnamed protein product [Paramecium sonneborni]|uniref:Uncharacterized protein n=1 Tax=Paramecium sonneborni TaxID=65129 RepID=A0A8S1Q3X2_9CILI|nr:unnamed protein product [Paramecium sonneborni]
MAQFIEYLVETGIITEKSYISTNNMMFQLSDYLKNLTASDSFDMANRIYDNWKLKQKRKQNPQCLIRLIAKMTYAKPFKILNSYSDSQKILSSIQQLNITQKSSCQVEYQSSVNKSKLSQMGLNDTCERLYQDGISQKVKKEYFEQEKYKQDLRECTFKPQINSDNLGSNDTEVFDRLYKTQLACKNNFSETKQKQEVSQCTFTPCINKQQSVSNYQPIEQIFDRLYQESINRNNMKLSLVPTSEEKEFQQCTFKPQISFRQLDRSGEDIFVRLHNESAEKQQIKVFQKIESEEKQLENCTFKPKINTHSNFSPSSQPAFDRLYMLSSKSRQVGQDESQKRQKTNPKIKENNSVGNNESLYERMKNHVNKRKRTLNLIQQEYDKELTFKPNINLRQGNLQNRLESRNQSISSVKSETKLKQHLNTSQTQQTRMCNTRKSLQDKENDNQTFFTETAHFKKDFQQRQSVQDLKI